MLSTSARIGLNPGSVRSSGKRVTGAPHDLQKLASATTIGWPHREQNLGFSNSASATEGKLRVAEPYAVAVAHAGWLGHAPVADERSVLAVEVFHREHAVGIFDTRMMARDRGMADHDFVVERAPDTGNRTGADGVGLPRLVHQARPLDLRVWSGQPRGDVRGIHRIDGERRLLAGRRRRPAQMEQHFVAANADSIAVAQVNAFDSLAVDEGAVLDREIPDHVVGAAPFDYGVSRLHGGIAEQADRILLGAADRRARAFDPVLASAQPALLDRDPRGLGQLLYQPDEQSDRKPGDRFAKEPRSQPAADDRADQIEADSTYRPAHQSAQRS